MLSIGDKDIILLDKDNTLIGGSNLGTMYALPDGV
jgi:hypothetical protein